MGFKSSLASLSSVTNPPDSLASLAQTFRKVQTGSKASKQSNNININISALDLKSFQKVLFELTPHI